VEAGAVWVFPLPGAGDVYPVFYYQEVEPLSSTVNSNIFSQYHEETLLYASLVAASQFISEDERTKSWLDLRDMEVTSVNEASKQAKMGSTPVRRRINTFMGAAGPPASAYGWR
jgi:hypothetical protein